MNNHNEILNGITKTIEDSHYSYPEYRERIGSPIRPVEREFINGPILLDNYSFKNGEFLNDKNQPVDDNGENYCLFYKDGNVYIDSTNHVIDSTQASLLKGRLIYGETRNSEDVSDDKALEIGDASTQFNEFATISDLAFGEDEDNSFQIGNNKPGGNA